jgi:hypothetical protein
MRRAWLVPAAAEHVAPIAAHARQADIDELWAQAHATPAECMTHGIEASVRAYTAMLDDVPVCMFGVVAAEAMGEGAPWMVGTTALDSLRAQKDVLRISRAAIAEFQALFPNLYNLVDDRNAAAKRWLQWLGFTVLPAKPLGMDGEMFCPFYQQGAA